MTSTFFLFHVFLFPLHLEVVELATDFFSPSTFNSVVYFKMWLSEVFDMW